MKHKLKRVLSLVLALCMVLSLTCINVYAASETEPEVTVTDTAEEASEEAASESVEAEPEAETEDFETEPEEAESEAAAEEEQSEAEAEETEAETEAEAEVESEAEDETDETEEDEASDEALISLVSEDDGISAVDDDSGSTTESVTVYTSGTSTVTVTSTSALSISDGTVYNSENTAIATYTVASSTVTTYSSYTLGSSAASSVSANSYYVIGNSSDGYLTVDSSGNLTTSTTVNEYSIWKAVSAGSNTYYLYNEATGYYLVLSGSSSGGYGEGGGGSTTYSLSASTSTSDRTAFSYSSSRGFYISERQGMSSNYTYYCISGNSYATGSGSSVYAVTLGTASTSYVYTITFTGVAAGTGSVTINGTTYDVTVKEMKTFDVYNDDGNVEETINLNYGWHIADITTTTDDDGEVSSISVITSPDDVVDGGYDEDLYFSTDEDENTTLNVTVYGYNLDSDGNVPDESEWVDLTMTIATGTGTIIGGRDNDEELTVGAYNENTLYNYDYVVIVPADGYYVVDLAAACNDVWDTTRTLNGTSLSSTFSSYTNALGQTEYTNVYGEGCETMGAGGTFTADYSPTEGTSITLSMETVLAEHYKSADTLGREDPYFLLIELAKIPTPLYVEYESGTAAAYTDDAIVSTSGTDFYAISTDETSYVSFIETRDALEASIYQYTVLDPAYTTYTTTDGTTYYFTGWELTYYTEATGTYENEETGYIYTNTDATTYEYPTLSDAFGLSSSISYGSNASIYLFTHVKLVAQWTTVKLNDVSYVVDFGLPVSLDVAAQCSSEDKSGYTWTLTNIASYPDYGTAAISSDGTSITYTMNEVMTGSTTMMVAVQGTKDSSTITAVVNVTIYPATTVYYEEGFATYGTTWSVSDGGSWSGNTTINYTDIQETHVANTASDENKISYYVYGYDSVYASDEFGSNNTNAVSTTNADSLSFSFTGTGVDIYATGLTNTGTVLIRIVKNTTDEETGETTSTSVKMLNVDTINTGTYTSTTSYNTPIASVTGLEHGDYTVTMYVSTPRNSGIIFDGFRVYDTIDNDDEVTSGDAYDVQNTVYETDDEDYPDYTEIRNVVLTALLGDSDAINYTEDYVHSMSIADAQVYASSDTGVAVYCAADSTYTFTTLATLMDDGTKNELYLPSGVTLVLKLDESEADRVVQIGVKGINGTGTVTLNTDDTDGITVSTVDMFYEASVNKTEDGSYVTIKNIGNSTISLTKLKACDEPISISSEAITESEMAALLSGSTEDTENTDNTEDEEETAVFEPETFTVSTSVKTSSKSATVTVTAKTSTDVESITVNGTEVTSYKTVTERSGQGRNATTTTYRRFTYTETVTASGTYTYEVTAVNADGVASTATTATATVTLRSNGNRR